MSSCAGTPGKTRDVEVDDIISYHDVVTAEKASLQKGMNYGVGKKYSVFLMSLRDNAPYADALDPVTGMLIPQARERSRLTAAARLKPRFS